MTTEEGEYEQNKNLSEIHIEDPTINRTEEQPEIRYLLLTSKFK
jgi:hypothetical protein